jgi:transposase
MRAYSEDLRKKKIVAAIEQRGMSKAEAARTFDVSLSSVKRYARSVRQGESLTPKKSPGRTRIVDEKAQVLLKEDVKERPGSTYPEKI